MARWELYVKFNKQLSFFKRTTVAWHSLAGDHLGATRFDYVSGCLSYHQITAVEMLLARKKIKKQKESN